MATARPARVYDGRESAKTQLRLNGLSSFAPLRTIFVVVCAMGVTGCACYPAIRTASVRVYADNELRDHGPDQFLLAPQPTLAAFDIARNCRAEVGAVGTTLESCTNAETDAKDELAKRWSQFSASQKKFCVGTSSIGGDQSYVELLTCLEMPSGQFRERQKQ